MKRLMHLNLFIQSRGHHEAAWRHPKSSPLPLTDIDYTVEMAQKAEAGLFDSIFLADVLGLWNDVQDRKSTRLNSSHQIISYAVFCLKKKKCNKSYIGTISHPLRIKLPGSFTGSQSLVLSICLAQLTCVLLRVNHDIHYALDSSSSCV